ncbi:MAG: hypothetical protein ACTSP5_06560 [Candidatus Heimdallarchaeota archaeon]
MDLTAEKLDEIVEDIWINHIKRDFSEKRILYYEATLVAAFYHYLRAEIDKYPNFRIFLEHRLNVKETEDEKRKPFDLVIAKVNHEQEWEKHQHLHKIKNLDYWAIFEFKFNTNTIYIDFRKDFEKLQNAKNNTTKRAYIVEIFEEFSDYVKVGKEDEWMDDFYRECIATMKRKKWNFEFKTGEGILKTD